MESSRTMRLVQFSGLFIALYLNLFSGTSNASNVACFYTSWSQYRPGPGAFGVANINASLCTHLYYAFAKIVGNQIQAFEANDNAGWTSFNNLKTVNPNLKTILSVGGATLSGPFSTMASLKDSRTEFINSAISLLRSTGFDGLDIDWEFPGTADKDNFTLLVQEAYAAFVAEGTSTSRARLLLSISAPAGITHITDGYDISGINSYIDLLNVMAYDYHGSWETTTNLATPLTDTGDTFSVTTTINKYLSLGASREKVQLGLAFYAHTWAVSGTDSRIGAPATGAGLEGDYTNTPGLLSYYEVCSYVKDKGCVPQYENTYGFVYYCSTGGIWITFENVTSIEEKLNYIEKNGLGGAMIWTLDFDDFSGQFCGLGPAPLTNQVSSRVLSMTTASTTPSSSTTAGYGCLQPSGFFPTNNCSFYIECSQGISSLPVECPTDAIFNPNTKLCEPVATTTYVCPYTATTTASTTVQTSASTSTVASTSTSTEPSTSTSTATSTSTSTEPSTSTSTVTSTSTQPSTTIDSTTTPNTATMTGALTTSTIQISTQPQAGCLQPNGYFPTENCSFYLDCNNGIARGPFQCPDATIFNPNTKLCEGVATTTYVCPASATAASSTTTSATTEPSTSTSTQTSTSTSTETSISTSTATSTSTSTEPSTSTSTITSTSTTESTTAPTTTQVSSTSTAQTTPQPRNVCLQPNGYFPTENCSFYLDCNNGIARGPFQCPDATIFNPNTKLCEGVATTTYVCPASATTAASSTTATAEPTTSTSTQTSTSTVPSTSTSTETSTSTSTVTSTSTSTEPSTSTSTITSTSTTESTTTPTTTQVSSTSTAQTTPQSGCLQPNGYFPTENCSFYLDCNNGIARGPFQCPDATIFNPNTKLCEGVATTTYVCPVSNTATTTVASTTTGSDTTTVASTTTAADTTTVASTTTVADTTTSTVASTTTVPDTTTTTVASTTTLPDTTTTVVSTTTVPMTTTVASTTVSTTVPSSRQETTTVFQCGEKYGMFADANCSYFIVCNKGIANRVRCPQPTIFDPNVKKCVTAGTTSYTCPTS